MLLSLKIKNFALIADQTIVFDKGFNVLVGETGSGKSLILDALSFVLGDKASKLNLRSGESKLFVQAVFDNDSHEIQDWLKNNCIDADDYLIITRSQNLEGKTECRVNDVMITATSLKLLSGFLVDAYAQNESIELLKVKNHIKILDSYAQDLVIPIKVLIAEKINALNELKKQMDFIGGNQANRERELELLNFQINDIENAQLSIGEDDEIRNKITKLSNYEKIYDKVKIANDLLSNVLPELINCSNCLDFAGKFEDELQSLNNRLISCKIELEDVNDFLNSFLSNFDFNQLLEC